MSKDFLCIGECMVEMAPDATGGRFDLGFAGDTFNTAWYLKALAPKAGVQYLTRVGQDDISDRFVDFARTAGIGTELIGRDEDRTLGLYLISLQDGERSFAYWRGQSAARRLADDPDTLAAALAGAKVVYFSGITLGILTPEGRDTLFKAVATARAGGAIIAFDPNLRPRLWDSPTTMCDAIMQAAATSDIALPSFDDEAQYFGDANPLATLARYQGAGVGTAIVKNGAQQIVYSQNGTTGTIHIAPATKVVDSTAAGDSFNAGVLAALWAGQPIDQSIVQGSQVARRVIGGRGALVPLTA
ncbi:MAG: sugar kinase [Flavimaricola sp.]|nr:sugar kinase [Flavimaricola sp.]